MHILQSAEELIHDVGFVDVLQYVCPDDSMQVRLHVIKNEVYILVILSLEHVLQPALDQSLATALHGIRRALLVKQHDAAEC